MGELITRFAPAPTGHLHIGHVVNALYVWNAARREGGRVLLRIEDHDGQRSRREYEAAILEDLAWLGFHADEPPVRQSERGAIYAAALEKLRAQGLVYACECSRREINAAGGGAELRYPGTCASKGLADAPGRALRVRLAPSDEAFDDLLQGPQVQNPSGQCGDLLARDRHGYWTYQFAATVDDFAQGVNLVIRGLDLLASTGRQIQLARLLGRTDPPRFLHHPLVMKAPDQKVSKSDGDSGIREMRAAGLTAATVIARGGQILNFSLPDESCQVAWHQKSGSTDSRSDPALSFWNQARSRTEYPQNASYRGQWLSTAGSSPQPTRTCWRGSPRGRPRPSVCCSGDGSRPSTGSRCT